MALTPTEYSLVWRRAFQQDKALWKDLANLPNKGEVRAAIDVLQAMWDDNLVANKTAIQTALDQPVSTALLKSLARAWLYELARRL